MSPSDLGVFGLDGRAAAADKASSRNAGADNTVAAGWLGKGCGAHGVRALRLLHRATQGGKQGLLAMPPRCVSDERAVFCFFESTQLARRVQPKRTQMEVQ